MELSRKQIAERLGTSRQFIDFIFAGKRSPSKETAAKLEQVTGISRLAWLYPDEFPNPYIGGGPDVSKVSEVREGTDTR